MPLSGMRSAAPCCPAVARGNRDMVSPSGTRGVGSTNVRAGRRRGFGSSGIVGRRDRVCRSGTQQHKSRFLRICARTKTSSVVWPGVLEVRPNGRPQAGTTSRRMFRSHAGRFGASGPMRPCPIADAEARAARETAKAEEAIAERLTAQAAKRASAPSLHGGGSSASDPSVTGL
jgi:hypothetical protein